MVRMTGILTESRRRYQTWCFWPLAVPYARITSSTSSSTTLLLCALQSTTCNIVHDPLSIDAWWAIGPLDCQPTKAVNLHLSAISSWNSQKAASRASLCFPDLRMQYCNTLHFRLCAIIQVKKAGKPMSSVSRTLGAFRTNLGILFCRLLPLVTDFRLRNRNRHLINFSQARLLGMLQIPTAPPTTALPCDGWPLTPDRHFKQHLWPPNGNHFEIGFW